GLAAHVDRELGPDGEALGRHVAHADADVERRRVGAGGDLTATVDRHPLAGNRALLHHEGDEPSLRAGLLDAADHVGAGEVLSERAAPPEAGADRIGPRSDAAPAP